MQLFGYVGWLGMSHWYQKMTKTEFGTIQVKILSQIGPKIDENGEKCTK